MIDVPTTTHTLDSLMGSFGVDYSHTKDYEEQKEVFDDYKVMFETYIKERIEIVRFNDKAIRDYEGDLND